MTRSVFWRGLEWVSLEHLRLDTEPAIRADGLVVGELDGTAFRLHYALECDRTWRVRNLLVEDVPQATRIELRADGKGCWTGPDGGAHDEFAGCIDVDISATPFTNTLPIRRLELEPGASSAIDVLYVAVFPTLELQRAEQRYTRLDAKAGTARYLYESVATGFRAELPVDGEGLVIDYPGIWERVAPEARSGSSGR